MTCCTAIYGFRGRFWLQNVMLMPQVLPEIFLLIIIGDKIQQYFNFRENTSQQLFIDFGFSGPH